LVLEGIEGFVFDFPACAGSSHQQHEVAVIESEIGDPGEVGYLAVRGMLSVL
jgi:hypothetical protein